MSSGHISTLEEGTLKEGTCWSWNGRRERSPKISRKGKRECVHRLIYERDVGQIPEGYNLVNLCNNRWCINPTHYKPVKRSEVTLYSDKTIAHRNKSKTHCKRGHKLKGDNLIVSALAHGLRQCKKCHRYNTVMNYRLRKQMAMEANPEETWPSRYTRAGPAAKLAKVLKGGKSN